MQMAMEDQRGNVVKKKHRSRGGASAECPVTPLHRGRSAKRPPAPCGANSRVLKTKRMPGGSIWRMRECAHGHRFTTEETPSDV